MKNTNRNMGKAIRMTAAAAVLLWAGTAAAQGGESGLRKACAAYLEAERVQDVDRQLGHIYPPFFEYFARDTVRMAMMLIRADSTLSIDGDSLLQVSDIITVNGKSYALCRFVQYLALDFSGMWDSGGAHLAIGMMYGELQLEYGAENVTLDTARRTIRTVLYHEAYVILDPAYKGWKFLARNDEMRAILKEILPAEVLGKL